jgi:CHAT domain
MFNIWSGTRGQARRALRSVPEEGDAEHRRADFKLRIARRRYPMRRILFLSSVPLDEDRIAVQTEEKQIRNAWRASKLRDSFTFENRGAVTINELRNALSEVRPHIVHFAGHGTAAGELLLEDSSGYSVAADPQALTDIFGMFADIECVVLNSCNSSAQADAIHVHAKYVIGIKDESDDEVSCKFSEIFYQSVCNGHDYDEAFQLATAQLKIEGLSDQYEAVLCRFKTSRILNPTQGAVINHGGHAVHGSVGEDVEGTVYLLTGGGPAGRYWPSPVIRDSKKWSGNVNVGTRKGEATISLVSVNDNVAQYIEFYRTSAEKLGHSGMPLLNMSYKLLDRVDVAINLMPLRERLVGRYSELAGGMHTTGRNVVVTLEGEWAIRMECSLDGKKEWHTVVMMDENNPNVGKGVYVLTDGGTGHHRIEYGPEGIIRVDGYAFDSGVGAKWENTNILRRI